MEEVVVRMAGSSHCCRVQGMAVSGQEDNRKVTTAGAGGEVQGGRRHPVPTLSQRGG